MTTFLAYILAGYLATEIPAGILAGIILEIGKELKGYGTIHGKSRA